MLQSLKVCGWYENNGLLWKEGVACDDDEWRRGQAFVTLSEDRGRRKDNGKDVLQKTTILLFYFFINMSEREESYVDPCVFLSVSHGNRSFSFLYAASYPPNIISFFSKNDRSIGGCMSGYGWNVRDPLERIQ